MATAVAYSRWLVRSVYYDLSHGQERVKQVSNNVEILRNFRILSVFDIKVESNSRLFESHIIDGLVSS